MLGRSIFHYLSRPTTSTLLKNVSLNFFVLAFVPFFLLRFNRSLKYVCISFVNNFRVGINRNSTMFLAFNQIFDNDNFCIFLEYSWIVAKIALTSSILILILNLPERLFLIDKTKRKVYKQNVFAKKFVLKSISSNSRLYIYS